jgi:hypothetical protein
MLDHIDQLPVAFLRGGKAAPVPAPTPARCPVIFHAWLPYASAASFTGWPMHAAQLDFLEVASTEAARAMIDISGAPAAIRYPPDDAPRGVA